MTTKSTRTCLLQPLMATTDMAGKWCGVCKSKAKWMQNNCCSQLVLCASVRLSPCCAEVSHHWKWSCFSVCTAPGQNSEKFICYVCNHSKGLYGQLCFLHWDKYFKCVSMQSWSYFWFCRLWIKWWYESFNSSLYCIVFLFCFFSPRMYTCKISQFLIIKTKIIMWFCFSFRLTFLKWWIGINSYWPTYGVQLQGITLKNPSILFLIISLLPSRLDHQFFHLHSFQSCIFNYGHLLCLVWAFLILIEEFWVFICCQM